MSNLNVSSDSVINDAVNAPIGDSTVFVTVDNTGVGGLKQENRIVDFDKINFDLGMNPRLPGAYTLENSGWMGRSLHTYGQQEPMLVSQRADGSLHNLRGFIRGAGVRHVRTTGIPAVKGDEKNQPAIPADPNFMLKVNVLIIKGLTRQQEIDLVMDHGTKTGLSDLEKFNSAKIMTQAGFSRALIAAKLKTTVSNFNNGIGRILGLPQCVEDAFVGLTKGIKITQETLKVLKPAMDEDQKLDGAKIRIGGPNFAAAWEKVAVEPAKRLTVMKRDDITNVANTVVNPDVRDILQAIRDNDGQGLASAIFRVESSIKLTTTTNSGFIRVEEGVSTVKADTADLLIS